MQVVLATGDMVDKTVLKKLDVFHGIDDMEELESPLQKILTAGFDHILTTNYSYELERAAGVCLRRDGIDCKKLARHTKEGKSIEPKYLLHTYNEVLYQGYRNKIWHIHGEARKPDSIIIGHYYYANLLAKYQEALKETGGKQLARQKEGKPPVESTWLDAFIMGDVYVLGFGFDTSEMDLWWLLNRKKREKARHGNMYFYEPGYNSVKAALLETYDVQVLNLGFSNALKDYKPFYEHVISDICNRVSSNKTAQNTD